MGIARESGWHYAIWIMEVHARTRLQAGGFQTIQAGPLIRSADGIAAGGPGEQLLQTRIHPA